jgi:hypothetical protein
MALKLLMSYSKSKNSWLYGSVAEKLLINFLILWLLDNFSIEILNSLYLSNIVFYFRNGSPSNDLISLSIFANYVSSKTCMTSLTLNFSYSKNSFHIYFFSSNNLSTSSTLWLECSFFLAHSWQIFFSHSLQYKINFWSLWI